MFRVSSYIVFTPAMSRTLPWNDASWEERRREAGGNRSEPAGVHITPGQLTFPTPCLALRYNAVDENGDSYISLTRTTLATPSKGPSCSNISTDYIQNFENDYMAVL